MRTLRSYARHGGGNRIRFRQNLRWAFHGHARSPILIAGIHQRPQARLQNLLTRLRQIDEAERLQPPLRGPHGKQHLHPFANGGFFQMKDQVQLQFFIQRLIDVEQPSGRRKPGAACRGRAADWAVVATSGTEPRILTRNARGGRMDRLTASFRAGGMGHIWLRVCHFTGCGARLPKNANLHRPSSYFLPAGDTPLAENTL